MKSWRKILWSVLTVAVAMLCSCNGGPDVPEPEIPDNQIIAYTASELTAPFATGAFMAKIKTNRFTPYASAEGGSGEIIFESPVFMVGAIAFRGCTALWTIDLPVDVEAIGRSAFDGCTNLRRVELLGDKITLLGEGAFSGCQDLLWLQGAEVYHLWLGGGGCLRQGLLWVLIAGEGGDSGECYFLGKLLL